MTFSAFRDFSLVSLPFTRGPGTYRDVRIYYTASGVSARPGDDFYPDEGWVWVKDGSSEGTINISLVFDGRIKPSSQFVVRIVEVSGGKFLNCCSCYLLFSTLFLLTIGYIGYIPVVQLFLSCLVSVEFKLFFQTRVSADLY